MVIVKFIYFLTKEKSVVTKSKNFFNWRCVYFVWPLEYLIKKLPVPTKRSTVGLINVKSCNALLHMLLLCICSYLKSGLWYKFLILETCHPDTYLCEQGCEDPWLFFEANRSPREKVWETLHFVIRPIWGWRRCIGNFLEWYVAINFEFRFQV